MPEKSTSQLGSGLPAAADREAAVAHQTQHAGTPAAAGDLHRNPPVALPTVTADVRTWIDGETADSPLADCKGILQADVLPSSGQDPKFRSGLGGVDAGWTASTPASPEPAAARHARQPNESPTGPCDSTHKGAALKPQGTAMTSSVAAAHAPLQDCQREAAVALATPLVVDQAVVSEARPSAEKASAPAVAPGPVQAPPAVLSSGNHKQSAAPCTGTGVCCS